MQAKAEQVRRHVLLVASNRAGVDLLRAQVVTMGAEVSVAETSVALKEVLTQTGEFDAVLMDIKLPPGDALRVAQFVRRKVRATCRVYVADRFVDDATMAQLESGGIARRLGVDECDLEKVAAKLLEAPAKPARYDVNVINCFVSSVNDVLEYYVGATPEHGKPGVASGKKTPPGFVTAVVRFEGRKHRGAASLTCDKSFIVDVAARVNGMPRRQVEGDQAAIVTTVEEMTDQIFGKAEILLGKIGFQFKMGAPEVFVGEGREVVIPSEVPVVVIPFTMTGKRFHIGFSLQEL